ncbi:hypothetical protein FDK21_18065 [Cohaesibacter sp. CAU 1516]|uniref:site-specific integrase n=1 Tax=Cohaesibacter sp. CAU 1516 TaxID=2576038 RepID=UPI0010FD3B3C|nr:site-specific integrase [Cohaesibacter sp. CAU 1516]TLP43122.1 hypothetical protein FDK21_18065 [Cohaesibacter sp. CAU 1516]
MSKSADLPKYVSLSKTGVYQYRRRVPESLKAHIGKSEIKSGFGKDYAEMMKQYGEFQATVNKLFSYKPKAGDNHGPVIVAAMKEFGLDMQALAAVSAGIDPDNEEEMGVAAAVDAMLESLMERKSSGQEAPAIPEELYRELTKGNTPITLADTLDEQRDRFIRRSPGSAKEIRNRFQRHKIALSNVIGKDLVQKRHLRNVRRINANQFRDKMLDNGLKPSSVRRSFSDINAAVNRAIQEHALDIINPFANVSIENAQHTKNDRMPFLPPEVALVDVMSGKDHLSLIWRLLRDTGARPKEIVGLRCRDLNSDGAFISICQYQGNRLKTPHSERDIPIPGDLAADLALLKTDNPSAALFPEYRDKPRGSDSCTAALNKRIRIALYSNEGAPLEGVEETEKRKTCYSARHSFKDALRDTDCPESLAREIMGHSDQSSAANYGRGSSLKRKREAMDRVWNL